MQEESGPTLLSFLLKSKLLCATAHCDTIWNSHNYILSNSDSKLWKVAIYLQILMLLLLLNNMILFKHWSREISSLSRDLPQSSIWFLIESEKEQMVDCVPSLPVTWCYLQPPRNHIWKNTMRIKPPSFYVFHLAQGDLLYMTNLYQDCKCP